jgi:hypothetical protein
LIKSDLTYKSPLPYLIRMRIILNQLMFALDQPNHCILEHLLQENPLLGVHDLVVAIFQFLVDLDVLDVEQRVVLEPLLVRTFVVEPQGTLVLVKGLGFQLHLGHQVVDSLQPFLVVITYWENRYLLDIFM